MPAGWADTETVVSKLTLKGKGLDALTASQRLTRLLQSVDLQPPGFPRDAILCIRRCRTEVPASWLARSQVTVPSLEWQRQVQGSIDAFLRRAVRPISESVSPTAEAVWFADRAELLACVAKDWSDGTLLNRWWWQSLFPRQEYDALFLRTWKESPEHIPSALRWLAHLGTLIPVIRRIPEPEARTFGQLLERTFGLTELANGPLSSTQGQPASTQLSIGARQNVWKQWVPELSQGALNVDQERFAGIGLMLRRAPSVVRSSAFAEAIQRWYRTVIGQDRPETDRKSRATQSQTKSVGNDGQGISTLEQTIQAAQSQTTGVDNGGQRSALGQTNQATQDQEPGVGNDKELLHRQSAERPAAPVHPYSPEPLQALQEHDGSPATNVHAERLAERIRDAVSDPSIRHSDREFQQTTEQLEVGIREAVPADSARRRVTPAPAWPLSHGSTIQTEQGGLFYLINVGLYLNLYGDFTQPLRPGLPLPIWDFLALVGERLIGPELLDDPVWPLLGQLAGREPDQPCGSTFDPPAEWQVSQDWWRIFASNKPWRWAWTEGRLQVQHAEDFLVLDRLMAEEPSVQDVESLLDGYGHEGELERVDNLFDQPEQSSLNRWLRWLLPYLRARLARALGCHVADAWPALLFNHRGSILVTDTRLDVTFSLNEHPLSIRMSGLDRDPGWVPAAGRYIAFHFESV